MKKVFTPKKIIKFLLGLCRYRFLKNGGLQLIFVTMLFLLIAGAHAQAPNISYSSPQVYTTGTSISPLTPTNTGGTVPTTTTTTLLSGLSSPNGIALDAAGNIYVADQLNNRVIKIPPAGGSYTVIGSGFNRPTNVAVDAAGNVYVADFGNKAVKEVLAGGGTVITLGSGFNTPYGIAVDAGGNVYVTDPGAHNVKKIPSGNGAPVSVGSGFSEPKAITIDASGIIYIADYLGGAVWQIAPSNGKMVNLIQTGDSPVFVTVDASGNVFFGYGGYINKLSLIGGGITNIGFSHVWGMAIDASGALYITDRGTNAVEKYVKTGGYSISPALPAGLIIDPGTGVISGTPLISKPAANYSVIAANSAGNSMATLNITVNAPAKPNISYSSPHVYTYNKAISPLSPVNGGGAVPTQTAITLATGFNSLSGIAVDTPGNVYAADTAYNVIRKIPAGSSNIVEIGSGFKRPAGVAVDGAGNVYVADFGNHKVKKIPAGGGAMVTLGSGFVSPYGIALDASGNIYVSDYGNSTVKEIPAGSNTPVSIGTGFKTPHGIAVDAAGNVYVADYGNNAIKEIFVGNGKTMTLASGLVLPSGIAVDKAGNIIITYVNNLYIASLIPVGGGRLAGLARGQGTCVALDRSGSVYAGSPNAIKIINAGGYFVSPALPAGLSMANGTGIISGTPTALSPATNYTITAYNSGGFNRASTNIKVASGNANLSNLKISSGTLSPSFTYVNNDYTASVASTVSSIKVTPTVSDTSARVTVNGTSVTSGTASGPIPLAYGSNTITTTVTAGDGVSTNTYTITVTRASSGSPDLSALSISSGTLTPAFSPATTNYSANVSNATTSVTVTPTTVDTSAAVKVNGTTVASGSPSGPISLVVGVNSISVEVTASDGTTTQTYTISVTRAASNNAYLSNLKISSGTIPFTPAFHYTTNSYTANVPNSTTAVTITPAAADATATIKVNGIPVTSKTASGAIALAAGPNTITTVVTAQDGTTTDTYTITITRAVSTNAYLSSISLTRPYAALTQVSGPHYKDFTASVSNATSSIEEIAKTSDATATITVNGAPATSGSATAPISLTVGSNTITTVVTAQDGVTTKTYVITVTRAAGPIANLNALSIAKPTGSLSVTKETGNDIIVHQGLSPNGDGMNDVLTIDGITNYPDNKLMIINRSGQLVYEARGYDNIAKVFDGRSNKTGAKQLPGTYFYSLDYNVKGVTKHRTGFIILKY